MPLIVIDAALRVIEKILDLVIVAMEGQTPEQKAKMWSWYVEDITWWRKTLKIDKDGQ